MAITLISTVTVGAGGATSIDFTSIPGTYTDLMVVLSTRTGTTGIGVSTYGSINGSTSTFSHKRLFGNGASAAGTGDSFGNYFADMDGGSTTASTFSNMSYYFPNYASSTNKSYSIDSVQENNATTAYSMIIAGLWATTTAITSLSFTVQSSGSYSQYSTASLYGITKGSSGGVTVA